MVNRTRTIRWLRVGCLPPVVGLAVSSCAETIVSPTQPSSSRLSCSTGEGPIARRYSEGRFEWECGPLPCPADKEAVWQPIPGSENTAGLWGLRSQEGLQKVKATCQGHCDSGQPRSPDGECPGYYALGSRFDENTLVITALIDKHHIPGVTVRINDPRLKGASGTTDANGEVRFDVASEPFRHVVEEDEKKLWEGWTIAGTFKDGRAVEGNASDYDSRMAKDDRQAALNETQKGASQEKAESARLAELTAKCRAGDKVSCMFLRAECDAAHSAPACEALPDGERAEQDALLTQEETQCNLRLRCHWDRDQKGCACAGPQRQGGTATGCDGCDEGSSKTRAEQRSRCGGDGACLMPLFQKDKSCRDQACPGW